jgi:hypothetical protein
MSEPTVVEVYGTNASQTTTALIVAKADMEAKGLTISANNTAESMLVYIVLSAAQNLTETNRLTDLPNRNVAIAYTGQDLIDQGGGNVFLRDTYQISLYRPTTIAAIDPDNY